MKACITSLLQIVAIFLFGCLFEEKEELCPDAESSGTGKIAEVNLIREMADKALVKINAGDKNPYPESTLVKADFAWIIDGNQDAQGDSIFVKFIKPLKAPPESVLSIDWPAEGGAAHTARLQSNEITLSGDSTTVILVLKGVLDIYSNVFPLYKTAPDTNRPPFLTLPPDSVFQGQTVPLHDSMGAAVVRITKGPSDSRYYQDLEGEVHRNPDTLWITLSEKVRALHNMGAPWDSLFRFYRFNGDKGTSFPLRAMPGTRPIAIDKDSLIWEFIPTNDPSVINPRGGDRIYLDPRAPWVDASTGANHPSGAPRELIAYVLPGFFYHSQISNPIVGVTSPVQPNPDQWIQPAYLNPDGTVDELKQKSCSDTIEASDVSIYPRNCLSTIKVLSSCAYTAHVKIFNIDGNLMHRSIQRFGFCGELKNGNRNTLNGPASWIVWNMRDLDGDFVGTGVYTWKVRFETPEGNHTSLYKQGIACIHEKPKPNCATAKME